MISYVTLMEQFGKFGMVDVVMRTPTPPRGYKGDPPWVEWDLTIYLQAPEKKDWTDVDYRRALFELSEQAIDLARSEYQLISAPQYNTAGQLIHYGRDIGLIEARLDLEFREK